MTPSVIPQLQFDRLIQEFSNTLRNLSAETRPKAFVIAHVIRHSYERLGQSQYLERWMKTKGKKTRTERAERKTWHLKART